MERDDGCASVRLELEACRKSEEKLRDEALEAFDGLNVEVRALREMYHRVHLALISGPESGVWVYRELDSVLDEKDIRTLTSNVERALSESGANPGAEDCDATIRDQGAEIKRLEIALKAKNDLIDSYHGHMSDLEQQSDELQASLENTTLEVQKLTRELEIRNASLDAIIAEKDEKAGMILRLQSVIIDLHADQAKLSSELDEKSEALKRLVDSLQHSRDEAANLKRQAELRTHAYNVASSRLVRLVNDVNALLRPPS